MKIYMYSDDIVLVDMWKKHLSGFALHVKDSIDELNQSENSIIILCAKSCENCEESIKALHVKKNRVLLLESIPSFNQAKRFLTLGVNGYGNSMMSAPFLQSAVMSIEEDMVWLPPQFTAKLMESIKSEKKKEDNSFLSNLTPKQKEITLLLKEGSSTNDIAQKLNLSTNTVKSHTKAIYEKLHVNSRLALAMLFR